jgi:CRISPR/Cas system CSM-associated protein Csm5 (group 7 of RAMP superfamily)
MVTAKSARGIVTSAVAEAELLLGFGSGWGDPTVATLVIKPEE